MGKKLIHFLNLTNVFMAFTLPLYIVQFQLDVLHMVSSFLLLSIHLKYIC